MLNAEFLRFASHWGFQPRSCRPYRAQTKGKVERPIRYIRESFHYGRAFVNNADVIDQAERWPVEVANVRQHGTTGEVPLARFERDERTALKPLAEQPYRHVGASPPPAKGSQGLPQVDVERRSLRAYAELVR